MEIKEKPLKSVTKQEDSTPHFVDIHVGQRMRLRRTMLGISQEKLGTALALTFQQVQKYERGANRISASRLHEISKVLKVPVAFFFEDLNTIEYPTPSLQTPNMLREDKGASYEAPTNDPMTRQETLRLVRAYYRIDDPAVRENFYSLLESYGRTTPSVKKQEG
jgi:transcriptional regulator with XRE-family HTH domain